ncbi:nose resistant to fluoxetine protein 6-like [Chrysoperla carnea]|uniref:nose resistant to fluoxetine protein 6-like n=1 Tax=Chrysoperla carnea TaxID=189513 RepID=UPI001D0926FF|nr:nose resistant to fluoxetine protein 6-like [Chrysoperla carnea]
MIDASSKLQSGFLSGHFADMGQFDQCLAVKYKVDSISGKFCYTKIKIPVSRRHEFSEIDIENIEPKINNAVQPFITPRAIFMGDAIIFRWSICVPSGCTAEDVKSHLNSYFQLPSNPILPGVKVYDVTEDDCHSLETAPKLDGGDWTVIGIFIGIACFVLCSTIYDVYLYYTEKEPIHKILIAFSWYSNFKSLIRINKNSDQLPCLNGIRFLSILWIIHGHEFLTFTYQELVNQIDLFHWIQKEPWSWFTMGSTVSVDTFFVLSGCLLMYGFLKSQAKKIPFNVPLMYFHRYVRLTPAYLAVILIYLTLLTDMGSGPIWNDAVNGLHTTCQKYWWSGILYIQNYVNANEDCVGQTWYLSVDMQLFVISPLILLSVKYWPKYVPYLFSTLVIVFTIIPTIVAWQYDLGVMIGGGDYFRVYYAQTYARAGPWILGLFLGYILYNTKNKVIRINRILVALLWLLTALAMLFIVFGNYKAMRSDYVRHEAYDAIFTGLHRNIWGLAIGWIIFACMHGYGGPVNWFLSLSMFQVLAKLTYSIYLLHMGIQGIRAGNVRINTYFSNMAVLFQFFGTTCITLLLAIIWVLTFEYPFAVIDNLIVGGVGGMVTKRSDKKEVK